METSLVPGRIRSRAEAPATWGTLLSRVVTDPGLDPDSAVPGADSGLEALTSPDKRLVLY